MAQTLRIKGLTPDVAWPNGVQAFCSLRNGGVSLPPYDSLNLGDHVLDDQASVQTNRVLLSDSIGVKPVFMQQVHGWDVLELTPQTPNSVAADVCITQ